jgi:hypothetical protein
METEKVGLSIKRLHGLRTQGYCNYSDSKLSELAFGNRFAYSACSLILLIGIGLSNIPILSTMLVISIFGVILPNHPFDYIYNNLLANLLNKPLLPPRSKQLKFACSLSAVWLAATIYLFYTGRTVAGYLVGGLQFLVALLVSTMDICIPSIIYNYLFKYEVK